MKETVKIFSIETEKHCSFIAIKFESDDHKFSGTLFVEKGEEIPTELEIIKED